MSTRKKTASAKAASIPVADGEVWAVPVPRIGFCPLLIARAPRADAEVDFAFAYLRPTAHKDLPKPDSIGPLGEWGTAWLGLVPSRPFKDGRWTRCGKLSRFDPADWPIPPARTSLVDESEPVEEWGKHPWGEMWSIETTPDEPTMTLISNTPATREEALRFPGIQVCTAASSFEKSLVTHLKGRPFGFWDMKLVLNKVGPNAAKFWREEGRRIRAAAPPTPASWLPAGRRTDRQLKGGAWLGLPLTGGGFGAAMLIEKPSRELRFFSDAVVMSMRRQWNHWPTMEDVCKLTAEDGAEVCQTSMICVRDGRWRVLGYQDGYDASMWPWPKPHKVKISPAIQRLDPQSAQRCNGMSSPGSIECGVPRIMNGTDPELTGSSDLCGGIVTPQRIAAWRAINAAAGT